MNILFIDTETTGLDPHTSAIVDIACEYWENGQQKSKFQRFIDLDTSSKTVKNLKALQINHYTTMLPNVSVTDNIAVDEFVTYLLSISNSKNVPVYIGGHNTSFDVNMISAWLSRHHYTGLNEVFSSTLIDTAALAVTLRDTGLLDIDRINLVALAQKLEVPVNASKAHRADYDVKLTAQCYYKMQSLLKDLGSYGKVK